MLTPKQRALLHRHLTIDGDGNVVGDHNDVRVVEGDIHLGPSGDTYVTVTSGAGRRVPLMRPPRAAYFTGREAALARLLDDLQPGRIITLCGPGGIGKTALAAEAVWTLAPGREPPARFPDGVVFHNFYQEPASALAFEAVARAYGEELRPTPYDAARRALAGKQALLVLDGTEDAEDLQKVLSVRGECGVLITSRTRRDAPDARQDMQPLAPDEAVALLRQWGRGRTPDARALRSICALTGYLPLAVRLAGRYLDETGETAAEYLAWLRATPLDALDHGDRRQDSVAVLLAKSLAQVSEDAYAVLAAVGLLALAPFDRKVMDVALRPEPAKGFVARIIHLLKQTGYKSELGSRRGLNALVRYGLLSRSGDRYEVTHSLIHTYARQRLQPGAGVLRRLAAYYEALAQDLSAVGLEGCRRLDKARGHLMHVLRVCAEHAQWKSVRALVLAAADYLDLQGYATEWLEALERGVAAAQALNRRWDEVVFLGNLGSVYRNLGEVEKAIGTHEQGLALAREIGDRTNEGNHLGSLGLAYHDLGEVEKAIGYFEQALAIYREIGDRRGKMLPLSGLGSAYRDLGEVEKAIGYREQGLALAREIADRRNEKNHLGWLGSAYYDLGEVEKAIEYYDQALTIAREIGDRRNEGAWLANLGGAYAEMGKVERAQAYLAQSLSILEAIKSPHTDTVRRLLDDLD